MEIKFRGINHETGEFVYGWYTKLCKGARKYDAIISDIDGSLVELYIHDSKSIGQFTGMKDKNGVEIYEGDIVKCLYNSVDTNYCEEVEYDSQSGFYPIQEPVDYDEIYASGNYWLVVGNAHQNPELLNA